ncbi:MAG TPA: citrate synthase [Polyangiaceae bacterium]|nr:citrate synthase [Polyangiaceae bacterium]
MTTAQVFEGLAGVLVAKTELSWVDGERGRLLVRGHAIESLVPSQPFEAVVALLLDGALPEPLRSTAWQRELGEARVRAAEHLRSRFAAIAAPDAMATLRSALSLLPSDATPADALGMAAVASAGWIRRARGGQLPAPEPGLPHAHDLLRLLSGGTVRESAARLLDAYLVTVAEHGFNASSFAARVAASTGADLASAVVAGVATLSGPLHGGAPGPVLDMLDAVGAPERAADYVRGELEAGRRIMGMGHRVYRVRDPRAFVLERALTAYQAGGAGSARLELARAVERAAEAELARRHPERALRANVEFYTALLLEALDIPRGAFTAIFGCARVAGYAAHVAEQRRSGRLIRPDALYVGKVVRIEDED